MHQAKKYTYIKKSQQKTHHKFGLTVSDGFWINQSMKHAKQFWKENYKMYLSLD